MRDKTTLEAIRERYAADTSRMNDCMMRQLASSNALMTQVITANLRTKGKQIRPLIVMMCARMFGPVTDKVISAATAIEMLHNASLIHDDVVDESMMRRNSPTINSVWDNHIAVLVGDYYTSGAMQQAISTGDIRIVDSLCRLGKKLSLGEIDQIYNAREHSLSEEAYYKIIEYKTASLFVASAEMGCYAAGVEDKHIIESLSEFARLFGLCFQIRDDIFDYYRSETVGKPTGNDLREGKITLPLLYALTVEDAPGHTAAAELAARQELTADEIERLCSFARDNGGIDYAFAAMKNLRDRGARLIEAVPDCPQRHELLDLFDFIIARDH